MSCREGIRFPSRNLPGSAEKWGRFVEETLRNLSSSQGRESTNFLNSQRSMGGVHALSAKQLEEIAFAESLANEAQLSADGKSTIWRTGTMPPGTDHKVGDTWFDESDDNKIYTWDGEKWVAAVLGKEALSEQINDTLQEAIDEATTARSEAMAALSRGVNMYPDPSFEYNGAGLVAISRWEVVQSSSAQQGDHVLRVLANTAGVVGQPSTFESISSGVPIRAEVWVKRTSTTQTGTASIRVQYQTDAGTSPATNIASVDLSTLTVGQWTQIAGGWETPAGTVGVRFYPYVSADAEGVEFDSVYAGRNADIQEALDAVSDLEAELGPRITTAQQDANAAAQEAAQAKQDALTAINTSDQASQDAQDAWNEALLAMEAAVTGGGNLYPDPSFEFKGYGLYPVPTQYEIIESPLARNGTHVMRVISDGTGLQALGQPNTYTPFTPPNANYLEAHIMRTSATQTGVFGLRFQSTGESTGASTAISVDVSTLPLNEWVKVSTTYKSVTQGRTGMRAYPVRVSGDLEGLLIDSVKHLDVTSAQQAMEEAEAAQNAASSAQTSATEAMTAADGKTRIWRSTSAPSLTNNSQGKTGDVWWRYSNSNYTGPITGQWTRKSDALDGWEPTQIESEVIANLTVDKLTVTGNATFPLAVVDTLVSDEQFTGLLYANQVIVSPQELAPGPGGYESAYTVGSNNSISASTADPSGAQFRIGADGSTNAAGRIIGPPIRVRPGEKIVCRIYVGVTGAPDAGLRVYAMWDESATAWTRFFSDPTGAGWYEGTVTVPEGRSVAQFALSATGGTQGNYYIRQVECYKQTGSILLEDGVITGDKVNATSVAAKIGEFIEVQASHIIGDTGAMNSAFIGQLVGDQAFISSLYTNRVLVDGHDFAPGPGGYEEVWDLIRASFVNNSNDPTGRAVRFNNGSGTGQVRGPRLPAREGQVFFLRARYSWYGSSNVGGSTSLRMEWFDSPDGARIGQSTAVTRQSGTGGAYIEGTVTAPAGTTHARFYVYMSGQTGDGDAAVYDFTARPQNSSVLIEDGAITGDKLAVNAIQAGSAAIAEAAITSAQIANLDAAKITTGTLEAARIAANTITGAKMQSSSFAGKTFTGGTFTGTTFQTAASGARTAMTTGGITTYNSSNQPLIQLGQGVSSGLAIRNDALNRMVPLADAAFGTLATLETNIITYQAPVGPGSDGLGRYSAVRRDASDNNEITFTAVSNKYIFDYSQAFFVSYDATDGGYYFSIKIFPSIRRTNESGNGLIQYVQGNASSDPGYISEGPVVALSRDTGTNGIQRRAIGLSGSTAVNTVIGQTYIARIYYQSQGQGNSNTTSPISVRNRFIRLTPVFS